jgi:hypothetical protein
MPFSKHIVPEEKFTPASYFEPAYPVNTTTAATVAASKATLSSCSSRALPVLASQNGDSAEATVSISNTTNNSASSNNSNVKNTLRTPEERRNQLKRKTNLRSTLSGIKIWKKSEIKCVFFQ